MTTEQRNEDAAKKAYFAKRRAVREMIVHEDQLVGSRMGWFSAIQALFFAGFAASSDLTSSEDFYQALFVVLGVFVSLLGTWAILISFRAISHLKADWKKFLQKDWVSAHYKKWEDEEGYIAIIGYEGKSGLDIGPEGFLPFGFLAAWIAVVLHELPSWLVP